MTQAASAHSAIPEETNDTRTAESTKELLPTGAKVVTLAVGATTACGGEPSSALLSLNAVPTARASLDVPIWRGWRAVPLLTIVNHNTRLLSFACLASIALGLSTAPVY